MKALDLVHGVVGLLFSATLAGSLVELIFVTGKVEVFAWLFICAAAVIIVMCLVIFFMAMCSSTNGTRSSEKGLKVYFNYLHARSAIASGIFAFVLCALAIDILINDRGGIDLVPEHGAILIPVAKFCEEHRDYEVFRAPCSFYIEHEETAAVTTTVATTTAPAPNATAVPAVDVIAARVEAWDDYLNKGGVWLTARAVSEEALFRIIEIIRLWVYFTLVVVVSAGGIASTAFVLSDPAERGIKAERLDARKRPVMNRGLFD